jgi:hypothetical protein
VVAWVPVTGLTLEDPGVTVGVSVVGATALGANVGAPVAGDTEWIPGVTVGVLVLGALVVVVWVPVTGLTLGNPGVTVGVPAVGATALGANVGAPVAVVQESQWVFLWWEHWRGSVGSSDRADTG